MNNLGNELLDSIQKKFSDAQPNISLTEIEKILEAEIFKAFKNSDAFKNNEEKIKCYRSLAQTLHSDKLPLYPEWYEFFEKNGGVKLPFQVLRKVMDKGKFHFSIDELLSSIAQSFNNASATITQLEIQEILDKEITRFFDSNQQNCSIDEIIQELTLNFEQQYLHSFCNTFLLNRDLEKLPQSLIFRITLIKRLTEKKSDNPLDMINRAFLLYIYHVSISNMYHSKDGKYYEDLNRRLKTEDLFFELYYYEKHPKWLKNIIYTFHLLITISLFLVNLVKAIILLIPGLLIALGMFITGLISLIVFSFAFLNHFSLEDFCKNVEASETIQDQRKRGSIDELITSIPALFFSSVGKGLYEMITDSNDVILWRCLKGLSLLLTIPFALVLSSFIVLILISSFIDCSLLAIKLLSAAIVNMPLRIFNYFKGASDDTQTPSENKPVLMIKCS